MLALLGSCTRLTDLSDSQEVRLSIKPMTSMMTRANNSVNIFPEADCSVWAFAKGRGDKNAAIASGDVFSGAPADSIWFGSQKSFWRMGDHLDIYAVAPASKNYRFTENDGVIIEGYDVESGRELLYSYDGIDTPTKKVVSYFPIAFADARCLVGFTFCGGNPGRTHYINRVLLKGVAHKGTFKTASHIWILDKDLIDKQVFYSEAGFPVTTADMLDLTNHSLYCLPQDCSCIELEVEYMYYDTLFNGLVPVTKSIMLSRPSIWEAGRKYIYDLILRPDGMEYKDLSIKED